jgi:hypothetical protein
MCFAVRWDAIEAAGVWVEAVALIAIFALDYRERRDARIEHSEQRKAREDERREREELRAERKRMEDDRQRADVTCLGVRVFAETVRVERLSSDLSKVTNSQPGFAIEKQLHVQLPEYLLRVCAPHGTEIGRATVGGSRNWLVFKFPYYGEYGAVVEDLRRLNFGERLIAWDANGKSISI